MRKKLFDLYEIDSDGYVINLKKNERMKSNSNSKNPYQKINLMVDKIKFTFLLHKLVVQSFVEKYDDSVHSIKFKDGNKHNCRLENLMLSTTKSLGYDKILYLEPIIIIEHKV